MRFIYMQGFLEYWRALCSLEESGGAVPEAEDKSYYLEAAMSMFGLFSSYP